MTTAKLIATTLTSAVFLLTTLYAAQAWIDDGQYHLECLYYGESMKMYTCWHSICIVCQKDGYTKPTSYCGGQKLQCSPNGTIDIEPPELTVNSPQEGDVFGLRAVPFDLTTNEPASYYYMDNDNQARGYQRICSNCDSYQRSLSFGDGLHDITIMASDVSGNQALHNVTFIVDSQQPVIRRTYPRSGDYTNGEFTVEYDEHNMQEAILYWQADGPWHAVSNFDCPKGKSQACTITVTDLPEGQIAYYFEIRDLANTVQSSQQTVQVDTVAPALSRVQPQNTPYDATNVPFDYQVSEPVELEYMDLEESSPRWRRLCSNCNSYARSQRFNDGPHHVKVRARDPAGNEDEDGIEFIVDSKAPRIRSMSPRSGDYANGVFEVEYDEDNVVEIELYYSQSPEKKVSKTDCPKGARKKCTFDFAGLGIQSELDQGDLDYWFVIKDIATEVQSRVYSVKVDTVKPQLTKHNPQSTPYDNRRVPFKFDVDEPVTLEYFDHSDSRARWKRLCTNCLTYDRTQTLNDGHHQVEVRARDPAGNSNSETIELWVDSRAPRIRTMEPRHGSYANGEFTLQLQEDNLQSVTLHYIENGLPEATSTMEGADCSYDGRYHTCGFSIALTEQGPLTYWFEVVDLSTTVYSRANEVTVDTLEPDLVVNEPSEPTYDSRYITVDLSIDEPSTLEYIDHEDYRPTYRRLCSRCDTYVRLRSFTTGFHNITFRATDNAGNTDEEDVSFTVIT